MARPQSLNKALSKMTLILGITHLAKLIEARARVSTHSETNGLSLHIAFYELDHERINFALFL